MDYVYVAIGFVILLVAGDALVRGAVGLSLKLGIPALIVSLTIVAFGTSAPELLISIKAALTGSAGLALGNVVGSNIANVLLVLGLPALLFGISGQDASPKSNFIYMMISTVIFVAMGLTGTLTFLNGVILLGLLVFVLFRAYQNAQKSRSAMKAATGEIPDADNVWWKILVALAIGVIGLPLGANLLVEGAVNIAKQAGVEDAIIGLTLVAIGTSLPELATTVMAAYRKEADVAFGNVIGSNLFNLLGVIGATSLITSMPVSQEFIGFDFWIMLASSFVLFPFIWFKINLGKFWGAVFLASYTVYIWMLFI
ncbi:calcium/sodium antiporter [Amylibacter sp. SFDW26]|uniref:calcium/sodium antiporter n=1 Tax=Amylibacter sp. SFDW26 TaxID=2652722 RepID=UPI0012625489|nr:calcium/sodium antiporter [Amylibacter sp. SFDW26]KAB7613978.1 calcium/sodium antiporter [Amylibacter sp. SFDW26]